MTICSSKMARHQGVKHQRLSQEKVGAGLSKYGEAQDSLKVKFSVVMQAVKVKTMLDREEDSGPKLCILPECIRGWSCRKSLARQGLWSTLGKSYGRSSLRLRSEIGHRG